ncbi:Serine/threonine protein like [Paragonimus heterotremus]|uniref:Serine/threonine protein like n=1 Tax=Paragonimus heterotremus TaxID=100268 RepID=A0A8J4T7J5_9TREM|nr:Serine/threonine protein like [Paragonimus heterotremus]
MCCILFNFEEPSLQVKSKEIKRLTLNEMAEFISMHQNFLTEPIYAGLVELLQTNAFRVFVPTNKIATDEFGGGEVEDAEDINYEVSWPHLQLVYETFLRFVSSPDFQAVLGKKYIDHKFLTNFVQLFDSEDPRERDYAKTILHRVYGKLVSLRSYIRQLIDNIFLRFVYEEDGHNGIGELLEIMESIINGFQVPLKEEHKLFLRRVLLPLHKSPTMMSYHSQLATCITEFIKKDPKLLVPVIIEGLLRFWPRTNSYKEVLFLNELEHCLEIAAASEFQSIVRPVFGQLAKCIVSEHFQVSERALYFWNNDHLVSMMSENVREIVPLIYKSLMQAKNHWNKEIENRRKQIDKWSRVEKAAQAAKDRPATVSKSYNIQQLPKTNYKSINSTEVDIGTINQYTPRAQRNVSTAYTISDRIPEPRQFRSSSLLEDSDLIRNQQAGFIETIQQPAPMNRPTRQFDPTPSTVKFTTYSSEEKIATNPVSLPNSNLSNQYQGTSVTPVNPEPSAGPSSVSKPANVSEDTKHRKKSKTSTKKADEFASLPTRQSPQLQ